jgi:cytochrome c-type biogenesis protein
MGFSFALYCAGCCGPAAIGSALLISGGRSLAGSALILLAYAAGMAIPFVLLAAGLAFALEALRKVLRFVPAVSAAGGAVAVVVGALLALEPVSAYLAR